MAGKPAVLLFFCIFNLIFVLCIPFISTFL
nr:MAG TPA: hypothetical protein [Caudoviricetes sp.]